MVKPSPMQVTIIVGMFAALMITTPAVHAESAASDWGTPKVSPNLGVGSVLAACDTPATNVPAPGGFAFDGVRIRTGPYLSCPAAGLGYTTHSVTTHCWAPGDTVGSYHTWTYLTNNTTGVKGWATDAYLTKPSLARC